MSLANRSTDIELEPLAPASRWAVPSVVITCAIASLCYAGAVSLAALFLYVLPGVLIGAFTSMAGLRSGPWWRGAVFGVLVGLAWAETINIVGGDADGPIARSTFAAAAATAIAVALLSSPVPAAFLIPIAAIVLESAVLGAAGEVSVVALVTTASALVALGIVENRRRRWLVPHSFRAATALLLAVMTLAAGVILLTQQAIHVGQPLVVDANSVNPAVRPPWEPPPPPPAPTPTPTASPTATPTASPTATPTVKPTPTPSPSPTKAPVPPESQDSFVLPLLVRIFLLLLLLALIAFVTWRLIRWWRLRQLRARLRSGTPAEQVVGAWLWTRNRLQARGLPLDPRISPDLIDESTLLALLTPAAQAGMHDLAQLVSDAAFAGDPHTLDPEAAWAAADRALAT